MGDLAALPAKSRLIVALDVPTKDEALEIVEQLRGAVSFFKVGLELIVGGAAPEIVGALTADQRVFLDLKMPTDIPETVKRTVRSVATRPGIEFLTLDVHTTAPAVLAAREGRGDRPHPKLLLVTWLSSLDANDLRSFRGKDDLDEHIRARAAFARSTGCEGVIASGEAIRIVRSEWPDAIIVSPGVRAPGAAADDHKRFSTPAEAIQSGADYLVVGRPVRNAADRRRAAEQIIEDIDRGLKLAAS
jgi:orotidine-5'-phosphate decarboxylase